MPCLACDVLADHGLRGLGLCVRCRGAIREIRLPLCQRCSRPLPGANLPPEYVCPSCRSAPPVCDRTLALWSYRPPIDAVIQALKFRRLAPLAVPLGQHLADRILAADLEIDLVSFVPLHWTRHMGRGYDQAREIATTVARRCHRPLVATLRRRRATPRQSSLPRNRRRANLRNAFGHRRRASIRGSRILLVDDVVTSGATLASAARSLKSAGAHSVMAAVVARTPSPGEKLRD